MNLPNSANSTNIIQNRKNTTVSDKSPKHELTQFKDPVSQTCLAGAVVASSSLTQEEASSNPFTVMINIFVTQFAESSESV